MIGGVRDGRVLELGPLEGGHSFMLQKAGALMVTAIEANVRALLKCLITKEITRLTACEFLCGDFIEYLRRTDTSYDAVLASGVLYHMTEPLELLHTHYYDEEALERNERLRHHLDGTQREIEAGGFVCTVHRYLYQEATKAPGFSGGVQAHSYWMKRADILAALRHYGYRRIEMNYNEPNHPNGPAFALVACRS